MPAGSANSRRSARKLRREKNAAGGQGRQAGKLRQRSGRHRPRPARLISMSGLLPPPRARASVRIPRREELVKGQRRGPPRHRLVWAGFSCRVLSGKHPASAFL